jgi:hypothetical protein
VVADFFEAGPCKSFDPTLLTICDLFSFDTPSACGGELIIAAHPSTGFPGDNILTIRIIFPLLVGLIVFKLNFGLGGCQCNYCSKDKIAHDYLLCLSFGHRKLCHLNESGFKRDYELALCVCANYNAV